MGGYKFVEFVLFKQISFLYIQTLLNDCEHIEGVARRHRSRAEFGLVLKKSADVQHSIPSCTGIWNMELYQKLKFH